MYTLMTQHNQKASKTKGKPPVSAAPGAAASRPSSLLCGFCDAFWPRWRRRRTRKTPPQLTNGNCCSNGVGLVAAPEQETNDISGGGDSGSYNTLAHDGEDDCFNDAAATMERGGAIASSMPSSYVGGNVVAAVSSTGLIRVGGVLAKSNLEIELVGNVWAEFRLRTRLLVKNYLRLSFERSPKDLNIKKLGNK